MKASRSRKYATPASRAIRRAILNKKHKDLAAPTRWTKEEIDTIAPPSVWDITKRHIIILVEEIERAYQYVELKDFLIAQEVLREYRCVPDDYIDAIIAFIQGDDSFEKLDTEDIRQALMVLNCGLRFRHFVVIPSSDNTNGMITVDESELEHVVEDEETFEKDQVRMDHYLNLNGGKPIFRLVYETLKMNHVLHQEPEAELAILKNKIDSALYYNQFIFEEHKYKEKTVTFAYDDCDASQEDIKTSLSVVGEILSVYISRSEQLHMAHVTFRDLKAANDAIYSAAQGELKLNGRPVSAVLTPYNRPTSDLPASTSQYTAAAMSALEELEDKLFADARNRYPALVEKVNGRNMDRKRKRDSGDLESDDMQSG